MEKNVIEFINKTSEAVGNHALEGFSTDCTDEFQDLNIKSPIEQMFYAAFKAVCITNHIDFLGLCDNQKYGIDIHPQYKIGKYFADFVVVGITRKNLSGERVVVECDGHKFHDIDKKQRSYEKARDRFLQKQGYKIFHYTGSDINRDPVKCAAEVIAFVMNDEGEDLYEYHKEYVRS